MRFASLPWYDLPELTAATDAWWAGLAAYLRRSGIEQVPERLDRHRGHHQQWQDPRLLLSQACGYDVLYDSRHDLVPIATPCYAAAGCRGPRYASVVMVHRRHPATDLEGLRGARCVVNEATSHSGTNALRALVAPLSRGGRFFARVSASGSHPDSLQALHRDDADVACIDSIVYQLMAQQRPTELAALRLVAHSAPALAPPYVTSSHTDAATRVRLQQGLMAASRDSALAACRRQLLIADFAVLPATTYRELAAFERPALHHGYFELPAPLSSPLYRPAQAMAAQRGACGGGPTQ